MASNEMICSTCKKQEDEENTLMKCSVCRVASYCSTECQKADWASHKAGCTKAGCLELITAIYENDSDTVARLAKTKRVLNGKVDYTPPVSEHCTSPNELGKWTALHECIRICNTEMMKILVSNGAKLEMKDADGETPVFVASSARSPELIKILLGAGGNPNALSTDGWSCLMMAARDGNYEITKTLLEAGADLNGGRDMFGRTALDIATQQSGGQVGLRMSDGETYAQAQEKARRVQSLLSEYAARNR
jgi:hypothetical protein